MVPRRTRPLRPTRHPYLPLNNPARANRYAYAGANPINYADPTGMSFCALSVQAFVYGVGAASFGVLAATGGGVVLGVTLAAAQAGIASAGLSGLAAITALLQDLTCD